MENQQVYIRTKALKDSPHCGDMAACWQRDNVATLMIVDGLGHGPLAEAAAKAATDFVSTHLDLPLADIFSGCDLALRHTRGVAMALGRLDMNANQLWFGGIGNIRTLLLGPKIVRFSPNNGIIGGGYRKLVLEQVRVSTGDLVFFYTDGMKEYFDPMKYGNLLGGNLETLVERIVDDHCRGTDDLAVMVYRVKGL